ncbi:hypothetical protein [Lactobacillus mulieris]|uniref:Uncharacterized protein n=1 Tax=Lactobacillus mulieris TaxID=2508708 RepID=A0ABT4K3R9_9LACO|nr:hypothetical protein [Lactobacillus mulieris]MCZ3621866.1 hypothetical protein [Lactobacillus mulieris]MCZ3623563.1 hypothetical protein [Lactobacillus mulieris]MCZ3635873.1 hypothetical protein [Lactobacillus mulieris]OEH66129.1 hypothetical protein BFX48_02050 [Lactobacillus jensenii]
MEAYALKDAYLSKLAAQVAFFNQVMKSTKGSGNNTRLVYDRFDKLYDYEKAVTKIRSQFEPDFKTTEEKQEFNFAEKLREFEALKKAGKIKAWADRTEAEKKIL